MSPAKVSFSTEHISEDTDGPVLCAAVVPRLITIGDDQPVQFPLYWLSSSTSGEAETLEPRLYELLAGVLTDPLVETLWLSSPAGRLKWASQWQELGYDWWAERQYLPGVTDNLGKTVQEALAIEGLSFGVASGSGFLFQKDRHPGEESIERYLRYRYYHPLTDRLAVHQLSHLAGNAGKLLGVPAVHLSEPASVALVDLDLSDEDLERLSRERVLALSLAEMKAIRNYFQQQPVSDQRAERGLPRWPTDVELEIIAQTWSEHCKHKIFNASIKYHHRDDNGMLAETVIDSLYKTYIQGATHQLKAGRPDLLSVFSDNSGVVAWNELWAVCFKVETHNSPSALEPYGGALTGILGVNRDILGTGLGAKPIFNTDVFCFPYPSPDLPKRPSMLPAEVIIQGVRRGVEDGGNKSGIPVVNGAVYFHPGFRAKPLVFCGTGGLLPLNVNGVCAYEKHTRSGDTIVMVGGRVGKDGIHGATFSSEPLHQGSPVSAVQIGDPFTQKRVLDFILEARDRGLITGITDNGAGGLSSSVGEMAELTAGATIHLDDIPLKYPGLVDWEIVVSESQERMTLSTDRFEELRKLAECFRVEVTAIGTFNDCGYFEVVRAGKPIALIDLEFLHKGVPKLELTARCPALERQVRIGPPPEELSLALLTLLAHPNISSREAIIRQYDHEVQGHSVIKPLMGPLQTAPCDAAVISPIYTESSGLVISNGLCPQLTEFDAYHMALCAVDEAVRNAVCVGCDPSSLSLLDNFCWADPIASPSNPDGEFKLYQLVRACQGLHDAVLAFGAPLISGKDSMKNDFDDGEIRISIPPTLLVSAIGKIPRVEQAVTMEFKEPGDVIYLLMAGEIGLAGSQFAQIQGWHPPNPASFDVNRAAALYKKVYQAVQQSWIRSCHDISDGGLAVALAESVIGSGLGAQVDIGPLMFHSNCTQGTRQENDLPQRTDMMLFGEGPGCLVITVSAADRQRWEEFWKSDSVMELGVVTDSPGMVIRNGQSEPLITVTHEMLSKAWNHPLPI